MIKSGYSYLLIVYIVWGSTYLAMRIGIGPESGFPVFSFGAVRCLLAAIILLLLAVINSKKVIPGKKQLIPLAVTGLAMWIGAHGLVLWSEQYIDSGFAAVAVSMVPLWVLIIDSFLEKVLPNGKHIFFILLGFIGVGVLMFPQLQHSRVNHKMSMLFLMISTFTWSACSVYLKKRPVALPALTISGYQHLFGSIGFLLLSVARHEPVPAPTAESWTALIFLVIFGSVIAFTSYIKMINLLPTALITTHTFVNPVIAVFLGWLFLKEQMSAYTLSAMILVITAIAGILFLTRPSGKHV